MGHTTWPASDTRGQGAARESAPATFSVVIPYYNEALFLPDTLASWCAQTRKPEQLILVDNGSTDGSEDICRSILAGQDAFPEILYLQEPEPGKIHALETACARANQGFVVLTDADTYYPPHYLARCDHLARRLPKGAVAIMALPVQGDPESLRVKFRLHALVWASKVLRKRAFVGGHGQILRTDVLARTGGFSTRYWEYVLLDHEIMHRMFRFGRAIYDADLWCRPSTRRGDRRCVRWSLLERGLYQGTPHQLKDWFFYRYLGPNLARRRMSQLNLREQPWIDAPAKETED